MEISRLQKFIYQLSIIFILIIHGNKVLAITIPASVARDTNARTGEIVRMFVKYDSLRFRDEDAAITLLKDILQRSEKINFIWGRGISLNRLGSHYQGRGQHPEALNYMLRCLPIAEAKENIYVSNILYNNIGLSYSAIGKYTQALTYYYKALTVIGRVHMNTGTDSVGVYNNVGILWARIGDLNYALHTFILAEKIVIRTKDTLQSAMTYLNIAVCYNELNNLAMSEEYFHKALSAASLKNLKTDQSTVLAGLSNIKRQQKDYKGALLYLDSSIAIGATHYMSSYASASRKLAEGNIYLDMGDYPKAKRLLEDAYKDATKMQHKELLGDLAPLLSKLYAATGEYGKAYEQLVGYDQMRDTILKDEQAHSVKVLTDVMTVEKDRAMLAQKLEIASQKSKLQQKNFWMGGTVLGSLLLLSLSFAFVRNNKHKQAIQQSVIQQLEQSQEINQLKAQMRGEEQERQRIAHELHDNIAGQLWAVKLNIDNLQQSTPDYDTYSKTLSDVYNQLNDAAQDIRKTAHNLLPDLLLQEGLATALASVCEKTGKNTNLEVDFQEYGIVPRIDNEIELSIYRMVQELVQNVLKHAQNATTLLVQLGCAGTMLNITVEDNGIGFFNEEIKEGVGLQQIRKRATALKGHFDIQSIPGQGTTAYLEFDLQHFL
jgi:signal transduction histidine kinase